MADSMDSMAGTWLDTAALAAVTRARAPGVVGAVLVGSSTWAAPEVVRDIDVTAFHPGQPLTEEGLVTARFDGRRLDIALHNTEYFRAVCMEDGLFLMNMRELRKLADGIVLFDDTGAVAETIRTAQARPIPLARFRPMIAALPDSWPGTWPDTPEALAVAWAVAMETVAFCWLHMKPAHRYGKPKWFLRNVDKTGAGPVRTLFRSDTEIARAQGALGPRIAALRALYAAHPELHHGREPHETLEDAETLVRAGRDAAALYPMRNAALALAAGLDGVGRGGSNAPRDRLARLSARDPGAAATILAGLARPDPMPAALVREMAQAKAALAALLPPEIEGVGPT